MSVMDKFLTAMKLNGEDDEYFDDEEYYDEREEAAMPTRKESAKAERMRDHEMARERERDMQQMPMQQPMPMMEASERRQNNNASIRQMPQGRQRKGPAMQQQHGMEICAIKPTSMEDTREVTDTLLKNRTVVLNLEGIDVDVAQRIVDFVSGSCYAIKGNLQKISRYIFIITPSSVDISGDFQEMIGGAFGSASSAD
ncbi:MAG: cell division protein SepF [Lachnospiraceae bacterium]|nr:cell division protein SepF [Lachnospiraceae bacterium]